MKTPLKSLSLRSQILTLLSVSCFLVIILIAGFKVHSEQCQVDRNLELLSEKSANLIKAFSTRPILPTLLDSVQQNTTGLVAIRVISSETKTSYASGEQISGDHPDLFESSQMIEGFGHVFMQFDRQLARRAMNTGSYFSIGLIGLAVVALFSIFYITLSITIIKPVNRLVLELNQSNPFSPSTNRDFNSLTDLIKQSQIDTAKANELAVSKMNSLSMMSHEIRTPLNSILGFSRLLKSETLPTEARTCVHNINFSCSLLKNIIDDILDFSKAEADCIELESSPIHITRFANQIHEIMIPLFHDSEVCFTTECEISPEPYVLADKHRLAQVLINLISNSAKFTKTGHVTLRIIPLDSQSDDDLRQFRFEIEDTGIGMTAEQTSKIFEPFAQASAQISGKFGGTGLGLAIAKKFVQALSGELKVVSEIDQGSCFSFDATFQTCEPAEEPIIEILTEERCYKKDSLNILVAEDEGVNRLLVTKVFAKLGYPVEFAEDGKVCIDKLSKKDYQAVLLDLHMPYFQGTDILQMLRAGEFGETNQEAKLAMMSADLLANQDPATESVDSFITKPIDLIQLKDFLDSIPICPEAKPKETKILVVEDQKLNRQLIAHLFNQFGHNPDFAHDGIECLEYLENNDDVDMIFLDLRMPRMDGWTVARKIRNGDIGEKVQKIPIAIVSAETGSEDTCRQLGVDEFITKPIEVSRIRNFIDRIERGEDLVLAN